VEGAKSQPLRDPFFMVKSKAVRKDETFTWFSTEIHLPSPHHWVLYKTEYYQAAGYFGRDRNWYCCSGTPEHLLVLAWRELA
jgi:hypothetical protein